MTKQFTSLGFMSGTSMDGLDASIIQSDGVEQYKELINTYIEYEPNMRKKITELRDKINNSNDLNKYIKELDKLDKELTIFHSKSFERIKKAFKGEIDLIGLHGQTIFHNSKEKISKQLGDGKLLSQLTKTNVVSNFRAKDLNKNGEGAPLTPIFHKLFVKNNNITLPVIILNIGGITNYTLISKKEEITIFKSSDIGPGNCLIDEWIKNNINKNFDKNGDIAKSGKINDVIINLAGDNWDNQEKKKSYDIKDFNLSFARGLSLEDGAATVTEYTAKILSNFINEIPNIDSVVVCGGGRKNNVLINSIKEKINCDLKLIDVFGTDGDFIESQAFAYIAIRSYLNLPITFPETTGCLEPSSGGDIHIFK